jgi:hypothetical protein
MMSDDSGGYFPHVWALVSAVAGAVTSLSFQQWEGMTRTKVVLSLFVATSFGFFVSPMVLTSIKDVRIGGGIIWLMAAGSNILIPRGVKAMSALMDRMFGTNTETKP